MTKTRKYQITEISGTMTICYDEYYNTFEEEEKKIDKLNKQSDLLGHDLLYHMRIVELEEKQRVEEAEQNEKQEVVANKKRKIKGYAIIMTDYEYTFYTFKNIDMFNLKINTIIKKLNKCKNIVNVIKYLKNNKYNYDIDVVNNVLALNIDGIIEVSLDKLGSLSTNDIVLAY